MRFMPALCMRFLPLFLALFIILAGQAGNAVGTVGYTIPLFTKELVFTSPTNSWSYWFELKPGIIIEAPSTLTLEYTCSPTLRPNEGSITVFLNNRPLSSRTLPSGKGEAIPWLVSLPTAELHEGYNEIRLVGRQRSIEGLCRDIDNAANWVRWKTTSSLRLTRRSLAHYPLAMYPFPYLDALAPVAVQSIWTVSPTASPDELAAMLEVASDWGHREFQRALPLTVTRTAALASHQVAFGARGQKMPQGTPPHSGLVRGTPDAAWSRLQVMGDSPKGLMTAVQALESVPLLAQCKQPSQIFSTPPNLPPTTPGPHEGTITLRELGYPHLTISGAFHQQAELILHRPPRCNLGKESFMTLRFHHAAALDPHRSTLLVTINGQPAGSVSLTPDNQRKGKGVLVVRIPLEELARDTWVVNLICYHDIGQVDCGKRYDDIAWTVIEGASSLTLAPGKVRGYPYLEQFPYLTGKDGRLPETTICWLPATPSDAELTTAAIIAARAGQVARQPIRWRVVLGDADPTLFKLGSVVCIGRINEAAHLAPCASVLRVVPQASGTYVIEPKLDLLPATLHEATLLQASPSPWNDRAVVYSILPADDAALARCSRILADMLFRDRLSGNVSVVTRDGDVLSFAAVSDSERTQQFTAELQRYTAPMALIMGVIILGVLSCLAWFIMLFFRPRKHLAPPAAVPTSAPIEAPAVADTAND